MKILFRALLILAVLIAGTYAASPLWLPHVLATQLPPGWELGNVDVRYPGLSGIRINSLSVSAVTPVASLNVSAEDVAVSYGTLKTDIDSVNLEIVLAAGERQDRFMLDDLALPVIDPGADLPQLSVQDLHLSFRHGLSKAVPDPMLLELRSFTLAPLAGGGWHFHSNLRPAGALKEAGRLTVETSSDAFSTELRFPSEPSLPPWLTLTLNQSTSGVESSTEIELNLDATGTGQDFIAALLASGYTGSSPGVGGKVHARARFSGQSLQVFDQMAASAQGLHVDFEDSAIWADLTILATKEAPGIKVTLPEPGQIRLQDRASRSVVLFKQLLPNLEFAAQTGAEVMARLENDMTLILQTDDGPAVRLQGDVEIGIRSEERSIGVDVRRLDLVMDGFKPQGPLRAQAEIGIDWKENTALTARLPGKILRAESLSLSSTGMVRYGEPVLEYQQAGKLELQHPDLVLAGDEASPPMSMAAQSIAAEFELSTQGGASISNGKAFMERPQVNDPPTTADAIRITWSDFDVDRMAGQLTVSTTGFATDIEGQPLSGIELDGGFSLDQDAVLRGTAAIMIRGGPNLPFTFDGNTVTGRWEIALPPATIPWDRLENTLRAGQFPWPAGVRMTGGEIGLQGQLTLADNLTVSLKTRASGLGAAILKNTTSDAGFDLDITLSDTLSVNGPISIENAVLAGGVQVSGFAADLEFSNAETLILHNLAAEVFDGTLRAAWLRVTPDGVEDTEIKLAHIDLARLLTFVDISGLQGTGNLGFTLPLGSDEAGVHVKGGRFQSADPGYISYRKKGVAASNIGLQALENFHYQSLSGTLEYQSKGAYQIGIRLEGNNPDLYGGHPIVFRLNINGVMPELFEALFMTGDFEESILKEIRTQ